MAEVIKCPACGALWRVKDAAPEYRCGACGRIFAAETAESVVVPDKKLDEAMLEKAKRTVLPEDNVPDAPLLADDTPPATDPRAVVYVPKRSPVRSFLLAVLVLILLAVACASAFLMMHGFVLAQAPFLRPVYENVCTKLPCPGFVWADVKAFRAEASLEADAQASLLRPTARVTLTNASALPQQLPVLEIKLLDPAGDALASRVLEPAEYGFPQKPAVLPAGESVSTAIAFKEALPHEAAGITVRPISADSLGL